MAIPSASVKNENLKNSDPGKILYRTNFSKSLALLQGLSSTKYE